MVVICPKCKVRLKVADEKIAPEGTRFKCPKCGTVLLVKRPSPRARPLDGKKVLVAHEDPVIAERIKSVLGAKGYDVITAADGIEAMVKATKELPFLSVLGVSIPKIYGFEVCKRLKSRPETKEMRVILLASVYDMRRYRREPESLHDADDYIEDHQIEDLLIEKINALRGIAEKEPPKPPEPVDKAPAEAPAAKERALPETRPVEEGPRPQFARTADPVERAKRLARTILSDIYLYSKTKVDESIRTGTFLKVFASELREGLKLYENRVSADVRGSGDFFNEAIRNFVEKRKREIG